jgi:hypothetical protein
MIRTFFVIGLAALCATGCKANSGSMVILKNTVPGDDCTVSSSTTATFLSRGLLHPDSEVGYVFTPVIQSRVTSNKNSPRLIFLEGAEVTLGAVADDGSETEVANFAQSFSGSITPSGSAGVAFEVTPVGLAEGEYVAHIQVFGTLDEGDVESQVFDFPITVSADGFYSNVGACDTLEPGYLGAIDGSTCNPLQDGTIECCSEGDSLICPAEGPPEEPV